MSNCPYSDKELDLWDSVTNPMGDECYTCDDFECEHNANYDEMVNNWGDDDL